MLAFGIYGLPIFLAGLTLYATGILLAWLWLDPRELRRLSAMNLILLLVNFAFFSTIPLAPFIDLSLAVYMALLAGMGPLALRLRSSTRTAMQFPLRPLALAFLGLVSFSFLPAAHIKEVAYFVGLSAAGFACWYFAANAISDDIKGVLTVLKAAFAVGAVSAGLAVWQLYSGSFKLFYFPYLAFRDQDIMQLWELVSRVVGSWQHPSYLGMYLAMMLPVGVYLLFLQSSPKFEKVLVWLGLALMGAVLLLTNTRSSALAGSLGAVLVFIFSIFRFARPKSSFSAVFRLSILIAAVAAGILLYQFAFVSEIYTKPQAYRVDASATIWGRFLQSDSMSTESLVQRSQLYNLAWQEFTAHPLFGIGAKNFSYEVEKVFGKGTDAHNVFLQFLAETGIVGTLSFIALFLGLLWSMFWRLLTSTDAETRLLRFVFFVELLLVLFDSQFNNPLFSLRLVGVFWLLMGLFYAIPKDNKTVNA